MVEALGALTSTLLQEEVKAQSVWQVKHSLALVRHPVGAEKDMAGEFGRSIANMGAKSSAQDQKFTTPEAGKSNRRHKQEDLGSLGPAAIQATPASLLWGKNQTQGAKKTERHELPISLRADPEKHSHFIGQKKRDRPLAWSKTPTF